MFLLFIWMCYNSVMLTGSCQCIQRYKSKLAPKGGPPLGWRMDQTQTELLWALLTAGESSTGRDWLDGLKKLDLEQITWGSRNDEGHTILVQWAFARFALSQLVRNSCSPFENNHCRSKSPITIDVTKVQNRFKKAAMTAAAYHLTEVPDLVESRKR